MPAGEGVCSVRARSVLRVCSVGARCTLGRMSTRLVTLPFGDAVAVDVDAPTFPLPSPRSPAGYGNHPAAWRGYTFALTKRADGGGGIGFALTPTPALAGAALRNAVQLARDIGARTAPALDGAPWSMNGGPDGGYPCIGTHAPLAPLRELAARAHALVWLDATSAPAWSPAAGWFPCVVEADPALDVLHDTPQHEGPRVRPSSIPWGRAIGVWWALVPAQLAA